jgi:hypothetical protein
VRGKRKTMSKFDIKKSFKRIQEPEFRAKLIAYYGRDKYEALLREYETYLTGEQLQKVPAKQKV